MSLLSSFARFRTDILSFLSPPPPFLPSTCWIRDGQLCVIFCGRIRRRREMPPLNATKINIKNRNARSNGKVYEWERPKAKTRNCFCSLGLYYKRPPPFMQLVSLLDALFLSFFPSFSPLERRYTAHTFPTKKDDFGLLVCSFFSFWMCTRASSAYLDPSIWRPLPLWLLLLCLEIELHCVLSRASKARYKVQEGVRGWLP